MVKFVACCDHYQNTGSTVVYCQLTDPLPDSMPMLARMGCQCKQPYLVLVVDECGVFFPIVAERDHWFAHQHVYKSVSCLLQTGIRWSVANSHIFILFLLNIP